MHRKHARTYPLIMAMERSWDLAFLWFFLFQGHMLSNTIIINSIITILSRFW